MQRKTQCSAVLLGLCSLVFLHLQGLAQSPTNTQPFHWPAGKRAALSLTFDDARLSQMDVGLDLLNKCGVKVTFYVQPSAVEERLAAWKRAVAGGHEIGNHTLTHPCTGNYQWSRGNALEDYSLPKMAAELDQANASIQQLLGVKPVTFAYPCGQKFIGRGLEVKSYVPLVAERFLLGRGWNDTSINDPALVDLPQATGTALDDLDYDQMIKLVSKAANEGRWLIFVGHEIGQRGPFITDSGALQALCKYVLDPHNGLWVDRVDAIAKYVAQQRAGGQK